MKINTINIYKHIFNPKLNIKNSFGLKLFALDTETVSFSARRNVNEEMKSLPEKAFPSKGLREFMLEEIKYTKNPTNSYVNWVLFND